MLELDSDKTKIFRCLALSATSLFLYIEENRNNALYYSVLKSTEKKSVKLDTGC